MQDIFSHTILCKKCSGKMKPVTIVKNGFQLRAIQCPKCNDKIIHPVDLEKFNKFNSIKNKQYKVKLRYVGNSYAISIPREIINFMNKQEEIMNKLVKLSFEDFDKISLMFNEQED